MFDNGGNIADTLTSASDVLDGKNHFITVVYTPNGANKDMYIYIDGRLDASGSKALMVNTSSTERYIGAGVAGSTPFTGNMYGFKYSNEFVTLTQHKDMYLKGSNYLG